MDYVVDNYDSIAEAALIVPMDETQAADAQSAARRRARGQLGPSAGRSTSKRWKPARKRQARRRGQGPRRRASSLGRGGHPRPALPRGRDLGPDHDRDPLRALGESIPFFQEVGSAFFTDANWTPLSPIPQYGIWPLLNGTFLITGIAILVAIPLGLGSAVYLRSTRRRGSAGSVKPILEVLVGVPTVVFGYFALTFVTPSPQASRRSTSTIFNALAAGLVMGIMIVPTIASISEDAMRRSPQGLREGAFGLGATRARSRPGSSSRPRSRASSPRSCSASRAASARR